MMANFREMSADEIITLVTQGIGPSNNTAAILEMQRRATDVQQTLIEAITGLDANMRASSEQLVRLAIETSAQTDKLITLTWWIVGLTIALGVIAAIQVYLMVNGGA